MRFIMAAALLFSLQAASAQSVVTYSQLCSVHSFGTEAMQWISMAFMLMLLAIVLAYMYSKLKSDPAMSLWAHEEGMNLAISVLLFVGLLGAFTLSCTLAGEHVGGSKDPFRISESYLRTLLNSKGLNTLRGLSSSSISNQMDATAYFYLGFTPFFGEGVAGKANLRAHSAQKEFIIDLYLPIVASLTAQLYILQGIKWVGASVLLPFAFVLRLFPFSRNFGNMLLALFFGLYVIVPTMYAMSGTAYLGIMNSPLERVNPSINMFWTYALDAPGTPAQDTVLYSVGSVIPQAVFIPNLVIIVAVTCMMAMSKALGAIAS